MLEGRLQAPPRCLQNTALGQEGNDISRNQPRNQPQAWPGIQAAAPGHALSMQAADSHLRGAGLGIFVATVPHVAMLIFCCLLHLMPAMQTRQAGWGKDKDWLEPLHLRASILWMSFAIPYPMHPVLKVDAPKHCELFLLNQNRLRNCKKPKLHMAIVKNRKYYEPSQRDVLKKTLLGSWEIKEPVTHHCRIKFPAWRMDVSA